MRKACCSFQLPLTTYSFDTLHLPCTVLSEHYQRLSLVQSCCGAELSVT